MTGNTRITITMPDELAAKVYEIARVEDRPLARVIRQAFSEFIERQRQEGRLPERGGGKT